MLDEILIRKIALVLNLSCTVQDLEYDGQFSQTEDGRTHKAIIAHAQKVDIDLLGPCNCWWWPGSRHDLPFLEISLSFPF